MAWFVCLFVQLSKRYRGTSEANGPLNELVRAFEMAERSSPGISEMLVKELLAKLVPSASESRIRSVVDRMVR